jgi:hypothetical protein
MSICTHRFKQYLNHGSSCGYVRSQNAILEAPSRRRQLHLPLVERSASRSISRLDRGLCLWGSACFWKFSPARKSSLAYKPTANQLIWVRWSGRTRAMPMQTMCASSDTRGPNFFSDFRPTESSGAYPYGTAKGHERGGLIAFAAGMVSIYRACFPSSRSKICNIAVVSFSYASDFSVQFTVNLNPGAVRQHNSATHPGVVESFYTALSSLLSASWRPMTDWLLLFLHIVSCFYGRLILLLPSHVAE